MTPFLRTTLAAALAAVLAACGGPSERPPDVLLISLDTLRADRLSCYGHDRPTSPNLDVLAAGGVRFETAVAPSIHTAPSHMSLFTGLDPLAHGVVNIRGAGVPVLRVADEVPTLPERFQRAGYRTAAFCDLGNMLPAMGFDRGFDHARFYLEPMRRKLKFLREWLDEQNEDRPLFVFFHTYATHAPYVPPPDLFGTFADEGYQGPVRARYDALVGLGPGESRMDHSREFLETWEGFGDADARFLSDLYDEAVLSADRQVGNLWRQWSERRDASRTLLAVTSDHGESLGEEGEWGHHSGTRRELVSVPLILRGPGVGTGVQRTPVSLTGFGATLCELAGVPPLEGQEGSFADLVRDPTADGGSREAVVQLVGQNRAVNYDALHRDGLHLMREVAGEDATTRVEHWADGLPTAQDGAELLRALEARTAAGAAQRARTPPIESRTPEEEELRNLEALGYLDSGG